jgi:small-conductance mechanosensitive channel
MEMYKLQILETVILLVLSLFIKLISRKAIEKAASNYDYKSPRVKLIKKILSVILTLVTFAFLLVIWGVKQSELFLFLSSILTVLGIAFFAQWSILSNITAALIIFFNHPVKIGDIIVVLDKEVMVEGRISDIGIFFLHIKTADNEDITIPSNIFIQKAIKKVNTD